MAEIVSYSLGFERCPLRASFGFKGGYVGELWNVSAQIVADSGRTGMGLGVQSVLWSDAAVFAAVSPAGGNACMYLITEYALSLLKGRKLCDPVTMLEELLPEVYAYAVQLTRMPKLRETFVLNALVPVDMALWSLYAAENGITGFDGLIPEHTACCLRERHEKVGNIPLVTYGMQEDEIRLLAENGAFFVKIKIGSDPGNDGDPEKMLAWDCARLQQLHRILSAYDTPYTDCAKPLYYLDANGRYDSRDRLLRLLDFAGHIGALERIALLEEPFAEGAGIDVHALPVRVAADESAHSLRDIAPLLELGYSAVALKPIAKTVSMSFLILEKAQELGAQCFCADLTVNPLMADWNKNFAARMTPLSGVKIGLMESNGAQNYAQWERMKTWHPMGGASWVTPKNGVFMLQEEFYRQSGGIFAQSSHYTSVAASKTI